MKARCGGAVAASIRALVATVFLWSSISGCYTSEGVRRTASVNAGEEVRVTYTDSVPFVTTGSTAKDESDWAMSGRRKRTVEGRVLSIEGESLTLLLIPNGEFRHPDTLQLSGEQVVSIDRKQVDVGATAGLFGGVLVGLGLASAILTGGRPGGSGGRQTGEEPVDATWVWWR